MTEDYQNLADEELIDLLARLTDRLASLRGINDTYEIVQQEIIAIQTEIESRDLLHKKGKWWSHLRR